MLPEDADRNKYSVVIVTYIKKDGEGFVWSVNVVAGPNASIMFGTQILTWPANIRLSWSSSITSNVDSVVDNDIKTCHAYSERTSGRVNETMKVKETSVIQKKWISDFLDKRGWCNLTGSS